MRSAACCLLPASISLGLEASSIGRRWRITSSGTAGVTDSHPFQVCGEASSRVFTGISAIFIDMTAAEAVGVDGTHVDSAEKQRSIAGQAIVDDG
ncbi:uncharacterized protein B0I36DRAFT_335028 [Microdochium trichocladiopsis]|uniref:Uncharacterized protein n=1 Tax=Microdochium trichocladiopsis TaxID=1682393 RepID=A0A9P8XXB5_9PEZI|nr:uncharacterized protein B0I36DRAFT_335028 [Microdochium trichocladiopsis]KAH7021652.1 hypothetical protein B0I36DRAFT_335028 [Microdochium trichocladiopsis]